MSQLLWGIFGGYSIWEYVGILFDNIPKIIYFLYAALASVIDALQCLLRRLVGLDVYWMVTDGGGTQAYTGKDPVLGFIEGILGIGKSAGVYSPLTTVFWSMTIFGVIVLALATMIAMIKAHYNEDSAKTSPMGYIYTAVKAVLTFVITPVTIIVGFWLCNFLLTTLDNITAGAATEETLRGVYGSGQAAKFEPISYAGEEDPNNTRGKLYTRYDFFGFGSASTSQTFSGMLFKTAAYDANRVRSGTYTKGEFGDMGVFGIEAPVDMKNSPWSDYTAYQVDYAFANNLNIKGAIWAEKLYYEAPNVLLTIESVDFFAFVGASDGFSKYNVGLVWYYYNLWKFNFMVGFIAIIMMLAIFGNIIVGVMVRLIKCVAYFLIFPGTLGLAPLDDFGAFKKWRTEFMGLMLMAFGAIIGMNLFFLIAPYLYNIKFFTFELLNYMVNVLMIICGLVTVKQIIAFLSSLIGGKDAYADGSAVSGEVKGMALKGAGAVAGAAGVAMKAAKFIPGVGTAVSMVGSKGLKALSTHLRAKGAQKAADSAKAGANALDLTAEDEEKAGRFLQSAQNTQTDLREKWAGTETGAANKAKYQKAAAARGLTGADADKFVQERMDADMMKDETFFNGNVKKRWETAQGAIDRGGYTEAQINNMNEAAQLREVAEQQTNRVKQIRAANYQNPDGSKMQGALKQKFGNAGKELLGALQKNLIDGLPKDLGINLGSIGGVFQKATNGKFDDKGALTGVYGATSDPVNQDATWKETQKRQKAASKGMVGDAIFGTIFGPRKAPEKKSSGEEAQLKSSENIDNASKRLADTTVALEAVIKNFDKAVKRMGDGKR